MTVGRPEHAPLQPARATPRLNLPHLHWSGADAGLPAGARSPRILIVDDEPANVTAVSLALERGGFRDLRSTNDPLEALPLYHQFDPDLILLDLHMPGLDGLSLLQRLRATIPPGSHLPILMITGDNAAAPRRAALAQGASDFLLKPFDPPEVVLRIRNLLETRALHLMLQQQNEELEAKVVARTRDLEEAQLEVLERLAIAAEFRDDETGRHTQRVATVSARLAEALALERRRIELILRSAPLHDVGKIGVPDQILLKPGKLTPEEFQVIKTHTIIGSRILGGGRSPLMQMAELVARSHHERWDGSGYPDGLRGDAIPLEARILALADFYDALTHARPYRPAWSVERVRSEIADHAGRHFDPELSAVFLGLACSSAVLA